MSATSRATPPTLLRWTPSLVALLLAAAVAWLVVLDRAAGSGTAMAGAMSSMSGTMGLSPGGFVGMWALMMAAMMLPSVAPVAALYTRTIQRRRALRLTAFTATYLGVWALAGLPGWGVIRAVELGATTPTARTAVASGVLVVVGLWQLTPLKQRCLRHCRSPLAQLMHYSSITGPARDVRVAAHHAAYCLGCCWGLMAVFVVTGAMHVGAMVGLTAVVAAEKLLPRGEAIAVATGVASLIAAVAVWWMPGLAPGLA